VDFELSVEQEELRDEFRRMLAARCDHDVRRAAIQQPGAIDRDLWSRLAETGVFSLRVPDVGAGLVEAVVVQEEVGRAAVPGPVVATQVVAPYLPDAASGAIVVSALFARSRPPIVEHLAGADLLAVVSPDEVRTISADLLSAEALPTPLDPLTPVHRYTLPLPSGEVVGGPDAAARIWQEGSLLTAATHVGLAAAAVDAGTAYAKERTQFGRPIGSFQAVKHLLADALAEVEVARAAVQAAAVAVDEQEGPAVRNRAVAGARLLASRAAQRSTRTSIQVQGGMGYTWEVDAHLYLKRALVLDTHFDTPVAAREHLVRALTEKVTT
jgi:alkylation response protein AidB-like acyl-CoA dehydrogenase